MRHLAVTSAVLFVMSGCVAMPDGPSGPGGPGGGGDDDVSVGDDDDMPPPPPPPPPPSPEPATSYLLDSELDVTVEALLPGPAYDVVSILRGLKEHPGETIFELLDRAGVPLLADLKAALPDVLESKLEGWIDDALAGALDIPQLDALIALTEAVVADVDVTSTLDLDAAAGTATHTIVALRFGAGGLDVEVAMPVEVATAAAYDVDGETLSIGEHSFGVPLGDYAWIAVNEALQAQTGHDVRGLLGEIVDCEQVASQVANMGVWPVEVGHQAELRALCEAGLDLVESELYAQVAALNWEVLELAAGAATLVDADADGTAEALAGGVWDARLDAGQGLREVPGAFTGAAL